ncbi:hypothetical protein A0H81_07498 [Grifola frondosa]|uniref:CobW/HypB/UreG nucleotide-binding domain-containing protein n=1 Tax=Grifola frondosa TaxID=5627 RepID=A0A1C7M793_GRIFR|nr:hypothetical protein A0H81_07498 [Grifola frondosa]
MQGFNKYYPPDYDGEKHGSLNAYRGKHALGDRARKIDQGILIVRFELPFNIWCGTCNNHIGMGVRYNAEKKKIGNYYSTPYTRFAANATCAMAGSRSRQTRRTRYVVTSGARQKDEDWDPEENGGFAVHETDPSQGPVDPLAALEKSTDAQNHMNSVQVPRLEALQALSDHYSTDPYGLSRMVRKRFRTQKKEDRAKEEADERIKSTYGLPEVLALAEESATSRADAKEQWVQGRQALKAQEGAKRRRLDEIGVVPNGLTGLRRTGTKADDRTSASASGYCVLRGSPLAPATKYERWRFTPCLATYTMASPPAATHQSHRHIPITVFTGFLGAGKTSIILSLLPQLPKDYRVVLLKNEFGDVEGTHEPLYQAQGDILTSIVLADDIVDSQLAKQSSLTAVSEILNGCMCCVLVGQMKTALLEIREKYRPDRIIIECSGSAFPATLAFQIRELERETEGDLKLDAIVTVVDAENFSGYEDTSPTARMQASYTDVILINKSEHISERALDILIDHLNTLNDSTPKIRCNGRSGVDPNLILGLDSKLFSRSESFNDHHHNEVETVTVYRATHPRAVAPMNTTMAAMAMLHVLATTSINNASSRT